MDIHKLNRIFKPKRIALIGVTSNPNSVGGKVLQNLTGGEFQGVVYPVNPDFESVLGIACFPDIASLPKIPDLVVICSAPNKVPALVYECGEKGILGIIIMSSGFKESGEVGRKLEDEIKKIRLKYKGMRILGPNCLGLISPANKLNISFASAMPKSGNIAFISQSGALCTSVLDWALEGKIGFSHVISIGNSMDVDFGDLIDYLGEDETTKSIILYIESISDARKFMTAARSFARSKPIIAYKAGRFAESAEVAASHTGALASEDSVYKAAFRRIGMARVYDIGDIFDCVELIGRNKIPKGSRLGIVTNAGGPGVIATDALIANNGKLARLSDATMKNLNVYLPPSWSHGNPVDVLGDARSKRVAKATTFVLEDAEVDAVLVILTPQAMTNPGATAKAIGELSASTQKPILTAWLGGMAMKESIKIFNDHNIPTYKTPEQAVRAFMTLVDYAKNLEALYETPLDIPVEFSLDRDKFRAKFNKIISQQGDILSEELSKKLIEAYGIPATVPYPSENIEEAIQHTDKTGYPVVLKIDSPDITHKSDAGGVILNIDSPELLRESFRNIIISAKKYNPDAKINGATVQKMVNTKDAVELIVGIKKDPVFGTIIMVGMGGTAAEIFKDSVIEFPPLNEKLCLKMLKSLKIWPLLKGFRGKPRVNIEKLIEVLIRFSYLTTDYPEIKELDINPLLVTPNEVIALDARIVIDNTIIENPLKPYEHLALYPYPEKWVTKKTLTDGTEIILRPIKPEDEPLWFDLLSSCTKESLYSRFRYFFKWNTHEVASRYCYIDYDREIAIVAEIKEQGKRRLLGVGRLISDPNHETVEYAILITDKWQNREIGSLLTDYCIDIASQWNLKRIYAQTTTDNTRMISVFKKRNFTIVFDKHSTAVDVVKEF
jgi:acetyltransferase